ncbi:hypothetical protein GCM10009552_26550 [Rothia nasimurium]|uniref:Methylamine utilization protein n=1 Tax=Luteibacter anthropi TaxID=564369 RepID=A0A7X5UET0_9GAMM|nr:methylamine utilization protein [Luteibacter anthropi]NII08994.1 methylamine utilization protein [Luteibacter anthropi]
MRSLFAVATSFALSASLAQAGTVRVEVVDVDGHPVPDAVVSLSPDGDKPARAIRPVTRYVDQKDQTFNPYVTAMHPGDSVVFRNSDEIDHQVYSFSDIARFEFVLDTGESSKPLKVDKTGVAAVGCNIHDRMLTYLYVTKDPDLVVTDARGQAHMDGVPAGHYMAHAWHPQLRPAITLPIQDLTVAGNGDTVLRFVVAPLLPDPRTAMDRTHPGM